MNDLCSGSGEPAITIFKKSNCFTQLILTDKYPNPIAIADGKISYATESRDVNIMKFEDVNHYTMFNSFHTLQMLKKK